VSGNPEAEGGGRCTVVPFFIHGILFIGLTRLSRMLEFLNQGRSGIHEMRSSPTGKILVMILYILGSAGTTAAAGLSYGFRIGPSTSGFFGDDALGLGSDQADLDSISGGPFLRYSFSKKFFLQTEITYIRKGEVYENLSTGLGLETKFQLEYIQWAGLGGWIFAPNIGLRPNLFLGPFISFPLSAKSERPASGPLGPIVTETIDIKNLIRSPDLGLILGLGIAIPSRWFDIHVDLRLYTGTRSVFLLDEFAGTQPLIFNGSALLMFGMEFGRGRFRRNAESEAEEQLKDEYSQPILQQGRNRRGDLEFRLAQPGDREIRSNPWDETPELKVAPAKAPQGEFRISISKELLREGIKSWSVDVVDSKGEVLRTIRHTPGKPLRPRSAKSFSRDLAKRGPHLFSGNGIRDRISPDFIFGAFWGVWIIFLACTLSNPEALTGIVITSSTLLFSARPLSVRLDPTGVVRPMGLPTTWDTGTPSFSIKNLRTARARLSASFLLYLSEPKLSV